MRGSSPRWSTIYTTKECIITGYRYTKEWRDTNKLKLIHALGGKCAVCSIIDHHSIYDLHHVDMNEKDFTIGSHIRSWASTKSEAEKCALLCSNCHRKIHANEVTLPEDYQRFDESLIPLELIKRGKIRIDSCPICGGPKQVKASFCSLVCTGTKARRVKRPPQAVLIEESKTLGFEAMGRKYGVSGNAIRKWIKPS